MSDANNSSNTETRDAESMKQKYKAKVARWPSLAQPWTIHRVPHSIREVDKDAYEPKMLSIGPYHRSNPNLQAMEDHKWRYVQAIVGRNPKRELSDYLEEMKRLEVEVRSFYSEYIETKSELEFVEMMLLDGCFIVELFLNVDVNRRNATAVTDDPIYSTKWILPIIRLDMLLLENQLPFLVVEHIFQLVNGTNTSPSIVELALRFFEPLLPKKKEISPANSSSYSINSIRHLLHLYHMHLIPTPQSDTTEGGYTSVAIDQDKKPVLPLRSIMSASELRHFLRLRDKENASSIADVKIEGGRLEIPTLFINHFTNSVLRNLIAWEHCYPECGTQFTSYAFFMDCLIDSPKDVAILKHLNIIEHCLGNNEAVALLFNQMCIGITYDWEDYFLSGLFKEVARMQKSRLRICGYRLVRYKFSEPWKLINFQIAFMTFVFAIIQVCISLKPTPF